MSNDGAAAEKRQSRRPMHAALHGGTDIPVRRFEGWMGLFSKIFSREIVE